MTLRNSPPEQPTLNVQLKGQLGGFHLDVDFQVPTPGITALFGHSGCGKTTILRAIAGLQQLTGRIQIGADVWQDERQFKPPHQRAVGYVFQEASLFPHLSVSKNLCYGLQRAKANPMSINFDTVVELLGLTRLLERTPAKLSGGERQRVAIGRALLSQPQLLLMDEPLSALDRLAKDEILPYFEALQSQLSVPIIWVTHDLSEIEPFADHIVVLKQGRILASGPFQSTLNNPQLPFWASQEVSSVIAATVLGYADDGIITVDAAGTKLLVLHQQLPVGHKVRLRIAAKDVSLSKQAHHGSSILNRIPAKILSMHTISPAEARLKLRSASGHGFEFHARVSQRSLQHLDLHPGELVMAQIHAVYVQAYR